MKSHIFRQYDIRGVVGEDLDPEVTEAVGRAFGSRVRLDTNSSPPTVTVGYDNRSTSPALAEGLISGIRSAGVDVLDVGTVPTPVLYWSEVTLGADAGVQITGSHNPPEWNGIKMTHGGSSLYGDAIQDLLRSIQASNFTSGSGGYERLTVLDRYVDDISGRFNLGRPMRVVVDCGNGTGSLLAVRLLEAIGVEVTPLFCESDPTFPNHHPDPTVDENLIDLIRTVESGNHDLGVAFDGDADRIGAVDDRGRIIRGDILLLLFGLDLLKKRGPGQKVIFDVKCSQVLPELFEEAGGEPIMWQTGHSLIKKKMRDTGALLAGELSGHIMIADDYLGFDDALYNACRLIEIISRSGHTLSEMVSDFPKYRSTPEIRIDVTEDQKWAVVSEAKAYFKEKYDVIGVDGVRILFGDGWALLRASNTQPAIVARFEARSEDRLIEIRTEISEWLTQAGVPFI
ncbi:MAG: phosphomannomutase/phosphoglucomutase [Gemmatimonadota bacterium]|nr:phosphomannomutase/phosphoglucomutase [Gemmatimonadota bacterium]MEC9316909.1 phosphomannomutase/phosphoglucomutase [Gemmatimonadota bacterium]MEC9355639.1 phosphomannomutase/phosphoglucomutase [Gemmatimonadota bacterium]